VPPAGLARLAPGFLSAHHFCWKGDSSWISPHSFVASVSLQLCRFQAFANRVVATAERSGGDVQRPLQVVHQTVNQVGQEVSSAGS